MSLENVKLFYARLAIDSALRAQIQVVESWQEGYRLAQSMGFNFTPEEFETYTHQILDEQVLPETSTDEPQGISEKELADIVGGMLQLKSNPTLIYGGPWPNNPWWEQR